MPLDPGRFLRQRPDGSLIDTPLSPVIDVFDAGIAAQPGSLQPLLERQILAPGVLPVYNQRQLLLEREIAGRFILLDGFQAVHHALQPHRNEFFYRRLVQHVLSHS